MPPSSLPQSLTNAEASQLPEPPAGLWRFDLSQQPTSSSQPVDTVAHRPSQFCAGRTLARTTVQPTTTSPSIQTVPSAAHSSERTFGALICAKGSMGKCSCNWRDGIYSCPPSVASRRANKYHPTSDPSPFSSDLARLTGASESVETKSRFAPMPPLLYPGHILGNPFYDPMINLAGTTEQSTNINPFRWSTYSNPTPPQPSQENMTSYDFPHVPPQNELRPSLYSPFTTPHLTSSTIATPSEGDLVDSLVGPFDSCDGAESEYDKALWPMNPCGSMDGPSILGGIATARSSTSSAPQNVGQDFPPHGYSHLSLAAPATRVPPFSNLPSPALPLAEGIASRPQTHVQHQQHTAVAPRPMLGTSPQPFSEDMNAYTHFAFFPRSTPASFIYDSTSPQTATYTVQHPPIPLHHPQPVRPKPHIVLPDSSTRSASLTPRHRRKRPREEDTEPPSPPLKFVHYAGGVEGRCECGEEGCK